MWGNHITAWNLVAWCNLTWRESQFEMAMLSQCSHFLILAARGCCCSLNVLFDASVLDLTNPVICHNVPDAGQFWHIVVCLQGTRSLSMAIGSVVVDCLGSGIMLELGMRKNCAFSDKQWSCSIHICDEQHHWECSIHCNMIDVSFQIGLPKPSAHFYQTRSACWMKEQSEKSQLSTILPSQLQNFVI